MNLTFKLFIKSVEITDSFISFGIPFYDSDKIKTIWFNFICVGVAFGKLKERGIASGDKLEVIKCYPKVQANGKLIWIVLDCI